MYVSRERDFAEANFRQAMKAPIGADDRILGEQFDLSLDQRLEQHLHLDSREMGDRHRTVSHIPAIDI